jgi:hypothetical protein
VDVMNEWPGGFYLLSSGGLVYCPAKCGTVHLIVKHRLSTIEADRLLLSIQPLSNVQIINWQIIFQQKGAALAAP